MYAIDRKVASVAQAMVNDGVPQALAFDPSIFAAIAAAIVQIIQAIASCNKTSAEAAGILKDPGPFQRLWLNRIIANQARKHIKDRSKRQQVLPSMKVGVLKTAAETTQEEVVWLTMEAAGIPDDHGDE